MRKGSSFILVTDMMDFFSESTEMILSDGTEYQVNTSR